MDKRYLGLLLSGVMLMSFAGCKSNEQEVITITPKPEIVNTATPEPTATLTPSQNPEVDVENDVKEEAKENETESTKPKPTATPAPDHEHDWTEKKVEPTCIKEGYTLKKCSVCDEENISDKVEATGHSYNPWEIVVEPTLETEGQIKRTCKTCGFIVEEKVDKLKPSHVYTPWKTEPTCTAEGFTTYTCTICGDTYIEDKVPAIGHDWQLSEDDEAKESCLHCGITK